MEQHSNKNIGDSKPCIFKVHKGMRRVNEKAYTPVLGSIGPYHHGRPKLLAIEKHKERYLELHLQRDNQRKENYLDLMKKLEERASKSYADPIDHLDSDNACFVSQFLLG